ncbi:MAG: penicillin-binding protein 2 [Acidimicrobiaceae bacterium]|nr:penicillin-binding protein 2 [Acidimicrobiaceae bacterium]
MALFVQLNYIQVLRADSISNNPLNGQRVVREYNRTRGNIISSDGVTLADSVPTPKDQFTYLRQYPTGPLFAQVTGFFSFTYGAEGAERSYDAVLTGANSQTSLPRNFNDLKNLLTNSNHSQSITLTVSDKLQRAAAAALGNRTGSVVALNPKTGAILAMYSNPSYDPNLLSQHDQTKVETAYKSLLAQPGNPLSPATYRQRWFPGSTFKMVTASAVYDRQPALATKSYPVSASLDLPDTQNVLRNFGGEVCGGQLPHLFTVSCNTGFGAIGLDLGAQHLADEAKDFGFNQVPPIDLPFAATSSFPSVSSFTHNRPILAYAAIGQASVQATPLQMAMVAGAFDDGGTIMIPHVLDHVTNTQDQVVNTYQPKPWLQAASRATAASMTRLMLSVVNSPNGTGTLAQIPGVQVAAKTGTAQTGTGQIDAWFAAFIPGKSIAVAVLVPDQPAGDQYQGGTIAAPIAKSVLQAYLSGANNSPSSSGGATTPTTAPVGGQ